MTNKPKEMAPAEPIEAEAIDMEAIHEIAESSKELMAKVAPSLPAVVEQPKPLIEDEKIAAMFEDTVANIKQDREEIGELLDQMKDMLLNGGDATTSTKEAVVNLMKMKLDTADKLSKVLDLGVRTRGVNTMPRWLAAQQNNTINIGSDAPAKKSLTPAQKRELIEQENQKMQKDVI
jgi:hypothetical protein